jgi:hypothetical protein
LIKAGRQAGSCSREELLTAYGSHCRGQGTAGGGGNAQAQPQGQQLPAVQGTQSSSCSR